MQLIFVLSSIPPLTPLTPTSCVVILYSSGSNHTLFPESRPDHIREMLFFLGYALLGTAILIFLFVSGSWWNEVMQLWWGPRTSSSVSDVHAKLKIGQSIVPAVYILTILFLLAVAAVLPALLHVDSYLSESSVVLLNFLTMAASLTALVVETRLKKFQIIAGLDALATRRAFVRYISHEVRTPLNIISLGLDLLEDELKEDDSNELNADYVASVQQVQDSCRVAVGIMNDLIQVTPPPPLVCSIIPLPPCTPPVPPVYIPHPPSSSLPNLCVTPTYSMIPCKMVT